MSGERSRVPGDQSSPEHTRPLPGRRIVDQRALLGGPADVGRAFGPSGELGSVLYLPAMTYPVSVLGLGGISINQARLLYATLGECLDYIDRTS